MKRGKPMHEISLPSTVQVEEFRHLLSARLGELTERAARIEAKLREPVDDDAMEQAIEREDDEPAEAVERAAVEEIARINAALRRIDQGGYGRCLSCGGPIALARLQAMPSAALCISCASGR